MLPKLAPHLKNYFNTLETSGRFLPGQATAEKFVAYRVLNGLIGRGLPFTRRNGFTIDALKAGYLRAHLPLKGNRNHMGTVYAGAQFLLAEVPFGALAILEFEGQYVPILRELTIRFHKPARSDLTLELILEEAVRERIEADIAANGKANLLLELALTDRDGETVATAKADYQVRSRKTVN